MTNVGQNMDLIEGVLCGRPGGAKYRREDDQC